MTGAPMLSEMAGRAALRQWIHDVAGICLGSDKDYLIESRLGPVRARLGASDWAGLLGELHRAPSGPWAEAVVDALTINETSWFRDGWPFQALAQEILPAWRQRHEGRRPLRLWSAACATGQEAYSLAFTLHRVAPWLTQAGQVEIWATDICQKALSQAREGRYSDFELSRGLGDAERQSHFVVDGGGWRVRPELRQLIRFESLNLARPLPQTGSFDLILCRNVLIYFDDVLRQRLLSQLLDRLDPEGALMLGSAEAGLLQAASGATGVGAWPWPGFPGLYRRALPPV